MQNKSFGLILTGVLLAASVVTALALELPGKKPSATTKPAETTQPDKPADTPESRPAESGAGKPAEPTSTTPPAGEAPKTATPAPTPEETKAAAAANAEEPEDPQAPKRFIPTAETSADNSATFPVDI